MGLDCTEKEKNARLWVPCTVHGICKYEFQQIFLKTGSHGTIHTFKNYFATVFSIFNNKRYPNGF